MTRSLFGSLARLRQSLLPILTGPPILAFLPAITLGAFWLGGEQALVLVSLGLPLVFVATGVLGRWPVAAQSARDSATGLILRDGFDAVLDRVHTETTSGGLTSACFLIELDDLHDLATRQGQDTADMAARRSGERIVAALRADDTVARLGDGRFAVCLFPVPQLDLELCLQLAGRIQTAVEDPVSVDGMAVYLSCSVGFCLRSRAPGKTAADWLSAANAALGDAQITGPSGIRAYSKEIHKRVQTRSDLRDDVAAALESMQIQPWYQPQISTDTGKITGFEALARWQHPVYGMIAPGDFLPTIEQAGLLERLGQVVLYHALTALKAWDAAGVHVPRVAVNFTTQELRNPGLIERLRWELDRFELTPDRLSVEILESVMTDNPDETVLRNIRGLGQLGCQIELDDFGTGHASIASIRRFAVSRIKIDRSFVMKSDCDPEQQRLIGAILTMAERLDMETLAEGVETVGEHAFLAQLGCDHVQGFGIARPMPFDQTLDWIATHTAKLTDTPRIGGSKP